MIKKKKKKKSCPVLVWLDCSVHAAATIVNKPVVALCFCHSSTPLEAAAVLPPKGHWLVMLHNNRLHMIQMGDFKIILQDLRLKISAFRLPYKVFMVIKLLLISQTDLNLFTSLLLTSFVPVMCSRIYIFSHLSYIFLTLHFSIYRLPCE